MVTAAVVRPEVTKTVPEPLADNCKFEFDAVALMVLSVMLMFESTVKFEMTTIPVPPGVKFKSAFELVPMMLSLNVILSTVVVPANVVVPVTVKELSVVSAEGTESVELMFVAPPSVTAPDTVIVPSTTRPSLMLIAVESSELRVVPCILSAPNTTEPDPLGSRLMFSFDLVPSMLLSLNLSAGIVIPPVPAGLKTMSSFDLTAEISFPVMESASVVIPGAENTSVKFSLTFCMATRKVSPVPSLAFDPMFNVCCAILYVNYPSNNFDHVVVSVIYSASQSEISTVDVRRNGYQTG